MRFDSYPQCASVKQQKVGSNFFKNTKKLYAMLINVVGKWVSK